MTSPYGARQAMFHQSASPLWVLIAALVVLAVMIGGFVYSFAADRTDRKRRRQQRELRRRKQTAYRRALAWLSRRPRNLQINDMRSETD